MCKMTPISVRLNLKNFILISFAVLELLRKVGIRPPPPGEIGLNRKIHNSTAETNKFHGVFSRPWSVIGLTLKGLRGGGSLPP